MSTLFDLSHAAPRTALVVEADGGSRGNPGPAGYGSLVRDADTGKILATEHGYVGKATNNVAEYRGLVAGLDMAHTLDPAADVVVRMDSKLVVEQMSGRWKIKHPDMAQLAARARALVKGRGVTYQWIPRAENSDADALANRAMDDRPAEPVRRILSTTTPEAPAGNPEPDHGLGTDAEDVWQPASSTEYHAGRPSSMRAPFSGSRPGTTLILVRHGRTPLTAERRMSGSGGSDPALSDQGRQDAGRAARAVGDLGRRGPWAHLDVPDAVVASPMRRTVETAEAIASVLGLHVDTDDELREASFGQWDGLTRAEVRQEWPELAEQWLGSTSVAPPGGESLDTFIARSRAARRHLVERYAGRTVVVVTHATPVRTAVADALACGPEAWWRLHVAPASVSVVRFWGDEAADVFTVNDCAHLG